VWLYGKERKEKPCHALLQLSLVKWKRKKRETLPHVAAAQSD
jgi:hypothetical protein